MTEALETHPSVTAYTPRWLALYDAVILGLSCSLVWKCSRRHMLELYNRNVGTPHVDIGVGTGYFLDHCREVGEPHAEVRGSFALFTARV